MDREDDEDDRGGERDDADETADDTDSDADLDRVVRDSWFGLRMPVTCNAAHIMNIYTCIYMYTYV